MVVVKWSYTVEGPTVKFYGPLCGVLYKEGGGSIVTWSGMEPYSKMNCFTWSCSIPGILYTARGSSLAVNDRTWAFE